jgi:hypothetical protein
MPDYNILVMDHDEEVFYISGYIVHNADPKFYRQAIPGPIADRWLIAIEAEIDTLRCNYS